jgi:hypothetical protein
LSGGHFGIVVVVDHELFEGEVPRQRKFVVCGHDLGHRSDVLDIVPGSRTGRGSEQRAAPSPAR